MNLKLDEHIWNHYKMLDIKFNSGSDMLYVDGVLFTRLWVRLNKVTWLS